MRQMRTTNAEGFSPHTLCCAQIGTDELHPEEIFLGRIAQGAQSGIAYVQLLFARSNQLTAYGLALGTSTFPPGPHLALAVSR